MKITRRAFGLGALAAALVPTAALADGDDRFGRGFPFGRRNFDTDGNTSIAISGGAGFPFGQSISISNNNGNWSGWFSSTLRLLPVGSVNGGAGGADFTASNGGGDGLGLGAVFLPGNGNQVQVCLRNAQANVGYDVLFERFQDHGREDLGTVTTDGSGNFTGTPPNALGNPSARAGLFVIAHNGQDQFVTVV